MSVSGALSNPQSACFLLFSLSQASRALSPPGSLPSLQPCHFKDTRIKGIDKSSEIESTRRVKQDGVGIVGWCQSTELEATVSMRPLFLGREQVRMGQTQKVVQAVENRASHCEVN